jgi:hypothetical protein
MQLSGFLPVSGSVSLPGAFLAKYMTPLLQMLRACFPELLFYLQFYFGTFIF